MNDDRIVAYLRDRGFAEAHPGLATAVMAAVEAAPPSRTRIAAALPLAATFAIAAGLLAVAFMARAPAASQAPVLSSAGSPSATALAEFPIESDDERFALCAGAEVRDHVIAAFAFRAADYQLQFPNMGLSPELDVDKPAFAVVFEAGFVPPFATYGGFATGTLPPMTQHVVCVYVGTPPDGDASFYVNVDVTGMRTEAVATAQPTASASPLGQPSVAPSATQPPNYVAQPHLPITVIADAAADVAFETVTTCRSPSGFAVDVPAGWHTNAPTRDTPPCTWFAPDRFDESIRPVAVKPTPPDGVWIVLELVDGLTGYTTITPIYMSETVTIDGYEGHRAEFGPSTSEEITSRPDYRAYWYVIPHSDEGPTFIARTNVDLATDYPLARAILDRMVASVRFDAP